MKMDLIMTDNKLIVNKSIDVRTQLKYHIFCTSSDLITNILFPMLNIDNREG